LIEFELYFNSAWDENVCQWNMIMKTAAKRRKNVNNRLKRKDKWVWDILNMIPQNSLQRKKERKNYDDDMSLYWQGRNRWIQSLNLFFCK
jgi:hypothetical protein